MTISSSEEVQYLQGVIWGRKLKTAIRLLGGTIEEKKWHPGLMSEAYRIKFEDGSGVWLPVKGEK